MRPRFVFQYTLDRKESQNDKEMMFFFISRDVLICSVYSAYILSVILELCLCLHLDSDG